MELDKATETILKPKAAQNFQLIILGGFMGISALSTYLGIRYSIKSEIKEVANEIISNQAIKDSIHISRQNEVFLMFANKIGEQENDFNKYQGLSEQVIKLKDEKFKLWKENIELKSENKDLKKNGHFFGLTQ